MMCIHICFGEKNILCKNRAENTRFDSTYQYRIWVREVNKLESISGPEYVLKDQVMLQYYVIVRIPATFMWNQNQSLILIH